MRNKLIVVGVIALAIFVSLSLLSKNTTRSKTNWFIQSASVGQPGMINAQIVGSDGDNTTTVNKAVAMGGSFTKTIARVNLPAISQRDKSQYSNDDEWRTWAPSACSAASIAAVLNGYGNNVRITEVLTYLQSQNAIKAGAGLFKYDVFSSIGNKYNLKVVYSENKDVEAHFDAVMAFLKDGYPVVLNILDPNFFPNGHFIVATGINGDGTIAIINPDPTSDKTVSQSWAVEGLKLYFSRMTRSAAYLPR